MYNIKIKNKKYIYIYNNIDFIHRKFIILAKHWTDKGTVKHDNSTWLWIHVAIKQRAATKTTKSQQQQQWKQ